MLFDNFKRTIVEPAEYRESSYAYINHSARPEAELVRKNLEEWFSTYPDKHKESFKKDFMDLGCLSFFSELLLHQTLLEFGAKDINIHPEIPGTDKKPDFKALFGDQDVVLEVKTICKDRNVVINQFQDELNQKYSTTGHLLSLTYEGDFSQTIPVNRFIQFLEDLEEKENFVALRESQKSLGYTQSWKFSPYDNDDNNAIHTKFFFSSDPTREHERPIGVISSYEAERINPSDIVLKSLKKKASRYGKLNMPYIIVLNYEEGCIDSSSIEGSLFGDLQEVSYCGARESRFERANNVLWRENKNTRVSGVLSLGAAGPWKFQEKSPVLWLNPWAENPFDSAGLKGRLTVFEMDKKTGYMRKSEGANFSEILKFDIDKRQAVR